MSPLRSRTAAALLALPLVISIASCGAEEEPERVDSAGTLASISLNRPSDDELTGPARPVARYVIVRNDLAGGAPDLPAIRAANPDAQVLLYKDAAFTVWSPEGDGTDAAGEPICPSFPYQGSGVDYCTADDYEDWFLHLASDPSQRLRSRGYEAQWAMDPETEAYQQAWADSVLARLGDADRDGNAAEGIGDRFDGVYIDDVNLRPGHGLGAQGIDGMPPADPAYPDGANPAYRDAMVSFVEHVSTEIGDEGFLIAGNVDADIYDDDDRAAALEVAADLDVYLQERFFRIYAEAPGTREPLIDLLYGDPATERSPDWSDWIDFMAAVQATGASWLGLTYGVDGDVEEQRFIRASFLLGWDGTEGGAVAYRSLDDTPGGPLGLDDWTTSVGIPRGDRYPVGTGWRRDFTDGTVVINPARAGNAPFELGGKYRLPDGPCSSFVELVPQTALILPSCEQRIASRG